MWLKILFTAVASFLATFSSPTNPATIYNENGIVIEYYWPKDQAAPHLGSDETEFHIYNTGTPKMEITLAGFDFWLDGQPQPIYSGTWEKFPSRTSWEKIEYVNIGKGAYSARPLVLEKGQKAKLHYHLSRRKDFSKTNKQSALLKLNFKVGKKEIVLKKNLERPLEKPKTTRKPQPAAKPKSPPRKPSAPDYFSDVSALPTCGDNKDLFLESPLNLSDFTFITPLGLLSPTAHVFPSPHLYFNVRRTDPGNYDSLPIEVPVTAPADLVITQVKYIRTEGRPEYDDGMVGFGICREFKGYFDHLKTFAPKIKAAYDKAPTKQCNEYPLSYPSGTLKFKLCEKEINLKIQKGEKIGTAGGGAGQKVFDFGAFDKRTAPKQFSNLAHWFGREHLAYNVCSLDYFPEPLKTQLKDRLGGYGRRGEVFSKNCGEIIQDITGTAMGVWAPKNNLIVGYEPIYIALVHENIEPQYLVFSVGDSVKESGLSRGKYTFLPRDSGFINRHFSQVTSDGQVYCYETEDTYQPNQAPKSTILITMPSPKKLRIEKSKLENCSQTPWTMENFTEFDR